MQSLAELSNSLSQTLTKPRRFTYAQKTGILSLNGKIWTVGWSGHGVGLNNHLWQEVHGMGPIPLGLWHIGPMEHSHVSSISGHKMFDSMALTPDVKTLDYGRDGFRIHGMTVGDSTELHLHPTSKNLHSSDGCIILNPDTRHAIAASGIDLLEVV